MDVITDDTRFISYHSLAVESHQPTAVNLLLYYDK